MNTQTLIQLLQHSESRIRLNAARILGMLDEVEAFQPLVKAFKRETDAQTINVMAWAGKRLKAAQANHYNTFEELWRHYGLQREVESAHQPDEDRYLGLDTHEMNMLHEQAKSDARKDRIQRRLYGSSLPGGTSPDEGLNATLLPRDTGGRRRVMPIQPTTTDIHVHVGRLLHDPRPDMRRKAAITLGDINNPAALSALAQSFLEDKAAEVRATAQHVGKRLYWNLLYWEMERDGLIQREIERRRAARGERPKTETALTQKKAIEDVLKRGLEKRKKK
jgi:hypothetical protein